MSECTEPEGQRVAYVVPGSPQHPVSAHHAAIEHLGVCPWCGAPAPACWHVEADYEGELLVDDEPGRAGRGAAFLVGRQVPGANVLLARWEDGRPQARLMVDGRDDELPTVLVPAGHSLHVRYVDDQWLVADIDRAQHQEYAGPVLCVLHEGTYAS